MFSKFRVVIFEGGDPARPCVLGGLWNGRDRPPASMDGAGRNERKVLRSRNGVTVTLEDRDGQERFVCETPGGQRLTLKDGPGGVLIEDSNRNTIDLGPAGVSITASAKLTLTANQIELSAGMVTINAAMSQFNGNTKALTTFSTCVVSTSYTPGAGNIL